MLHLRRVAPILLAVLAPLGLSAAAHATTPTPTPRIIDGTAPTQPWPAQTSVQFRISSGTYLCGGTLVSARWVLTAGHCATDDSGSAVAAGAYTLRVGSTTRTSGGSAATVDRVVRDPGFSESGGTPSYDVALLHLSSAVAQDPLGLITTTQAALWAPGVQATIIGWGVTESGSTSTTLKQAQVPIVSDGSCSNVFGSSFGAATMVCAGGGPTDTCNGDSGGPLMVPRGGGFALAGVTSWGSSPCATAGEPGVYARVGAPAINGWLRGLVPTIGLAASPDPPTAGVPVGLTATVQPGAQTATPTVSWDTDGDGAFDDATGTTATTTFATAGSHVVRVQAVYPDGDRSLDSEVVTAASVGSGSSPTGTSAPTSQSPSAAPGLAATTVGAKAQTSAPAGSFAAPRHVTLRTLRRRHLRVRFKCTRSCSISGSVTLSGRMARGLGIGSGKHAVTIGHAKRTLHAAGRAILVVRIAARFERALSRRSQTTIALSARLVAGTSRLHATRSISVRR